MTDLFAGWRFAMRRLRAGWRFMSVAAVGVLVAATLLAITPIYASTMSDMGLRFRLDDQLSNVGARLTYIEVDQLRLGDPVDRETARAMDEITEARLGWLAADVLTEDRSQRVDVWFVGNESPEAPVAVTERAAEPLRQDWGGFLYHLAGWEQHVSVVEGRMPQEPAAGALPEVVLIDGFQRHAALGDTLLLRGAGFTDCPNIPPSDDPAAAAEEVRCRPTARVASTTGVTVVGFVAPNDPGDGRWSIFQGVWEVSDEPVLPRLENVEANDPRRGLVQIGVGQMLMLTSQVQWDGALRAVLPESTSRHRSGVYVDTSRIGLGEVDYAIADMQAWLTDVRQGLEQTAPARTQVLTTLQGFRTAQSFSAVPMLVVLLQVVGIVIYYVAMVMAMLLERQQQEIGVFRSRGATTTQLVGMSFVEGMVFAIPALIVAPWLAAGVVSTLGRTPVFDVMTGGAPLPASVSPEAYLLAVGGGAMSLLAILLPAFVVVRRGIVDIKREESRPAEQNLLQRYYLDFALVALAGLLLWQLNQRGSVFDPDSVGGWSADPLLLASPFALTAAVSVMVLRFYPPLVRLAVRVLLVFRSTATAIGLRRAGRAPAAYSRVALLVIMAVAVGTFAASYGPTVNLSLADRARYESAVGFRGDLINLTDRGLGESLAALEALPEVRAADGVYRGTLRTTSGRDIPLLAIDPAMASEAMWWREDFSEVEFGELMRLLQSDIPPGGGYLLPEDATRIEVQLRTGQPERLFIQAQFRAANGFQIAQTLDFELTPDEWGVATVEIPFGERPWSLAGLAVSDRNAQNLRIEGALHIDELVVVRADGTRELLDDFEGPMRWMMLSAADTAEEFGVSTEGVFEGNQALTWTWAPLVTPRKRILAPGDPAIPLSVLMDPRAMGEFRATGDGRAFAQLTQVVMPLNIRAVVDYFPSMTPASGIVVMNLEHLQGAATLTGYTNFNFPNEVWLDFEPGVARASQRAVAEELQAGRLSPQVHRTWVLQSDRVGTADADPTLQVAGSGILVVAFVSVLGLCTVGFVVTMVVGARRRATEFAVLRAVGASRGEILRALLLEWGVVLIAGGVIGALVGRQVAQIMLGFLNVTETGAPVVPPFELATAWGTLGVGLGILVGVVLASLIVAWATSMRRSPTIELRVTQ